MGTVPPDSTQRCRASASIRSMTHSEYFTPGSESLFSVADIVSGHGDALEHDGMTAEHRHKTYFPPFPGSPIPPVVDPELPRIPHNDHRHTVPRALSLETKRTGRNDD